MVSSYPNQEVNLLPKIFSPAKGTDVKKWGNPQRKYRTYQTIDDHGHRYDAGVTDWVYERGRNKDMIVSVRNGEVIKIEPDQGLHKMDWYSNPSDI